MLSVSFFTPIMFDTQKDLLDQLLEMADSYFYWGQNVAHVISLNEKGEYQAILKTDSPTVITAIKVMSYFSLVLPFILLLTKAVLRSIYNVYLIKHNKETSQQIPVTSPTPLPTSSSTISSTANSSLVSQSCSSASSTSTTPSLIPQVTNSEILKKAVPTEPALDTAQKEGLLVNRSSLGALGSSTLALVGQAVVNNSSIGQLTDDNLPSISTILPSPSTLLVAGSVAAVAMAHSALTSTSTKSTQPKVVSSPVVKRAKGYVTKGKTHRASSILTHSSKKRPLSSIKEKISENSKQKSAPRKLVEDHSILPASLRAPLKVPTTGHLVKDSTLETVASTILSPSTGFVLTSVSPVENPGAMGKVSETSTSSASIRIPGAHTSKSTKVEGDPEKPILKHVTMGSGLSPEDHSILPVTLRTTINTSKTGQLVDGNPSNPLETATLSSSFNTASTSVSPLVGSAADTDTVIGSSSVTSQASSFICIPGAHTSKSTTVEGDLEKPILKHVTMGNGLSPEDQSILPVTLRTTNIDPKTGQLVDGNPSNPLETATLSSSLNSASTSVSPLIGSAVDNDTIIGSSSVTSQASSFIRIPGAHTSKSTTVEGDPEKPILKHVTMGSGLSPEDHSILPVTLRTTNIDPKTGQLVDGNPSNPLETATLSSSLNRASTSVSPLVGNAADTDIIIGLSSVTSQASSFIRVPGAHTSKSTTVEGDPEKLILKHVSIGSGLSHEDHSILPVTLRTTNIDSKTGQLVDGNPSNPLEIATLSSSLNTASTSVSPLVGSAADTDTIIGLSSVTSQASSSIRVPGAHTSKSTTVEGDPEKPILKHVTMGSGLSHEDHSILPVTLRTTNIDPKTGQLVDGNPSNPLEIATLSSSLSNASTSISPLVGSAAGTDKISLTSANSSVSSSIRVPGVNTTKSTKVEGDSEKPVLNHVTTGNGTRLEDNSFFAVMLNATIKTPKAGHLVDSNPFNPLETASLTPSLSTTSTSVATLIGSAADSDKITGTISATSSVSSSIRVPGAHTKKSTEVEGDSEKPVLNHVTTGNGTRLEDNSFFAVMLNATIRTPKAGHLSDDNSDTIGNATLTPFTPNRKTSLIVNPAVDNRLMSSVDETSLSSTILFPNTPVLNTPLASSAHLTSDQEPSLLQNISTLANSSFNYLKDSLFVPQMMMAFATPLTGQLTKNFTTLGSATFSPSPILPTSALQMSSSSSSEEVGKSSEARRKLDFTLSKSMMIDEMPTLTPAMIARLVYCLEMDDVDNYSRNIFSFGKDKYNQNTHYVSSFDVPGLEKFTFLCGESPIKEKNLLGAEQICYIHNLALEAKSICRENKFNLIVIPHAIKFEAEVRGQMLSFLARESLGLTRNAAFQEKLYATLPGLEEASRQLSLLSQFINRKEISKMEIPIIDDAVGFVGPRRIAFYALEGNPTSE